MITRRLISKILIGLLATSLLFMLFLKTLRQTESTPYVMDKTHVTGWTVRVNPSVGPEGPLLALAPPRELAMNLFQQVFERTMESMNAPAAYGITLVLRSEFDHALAEFFNTDELATLAKRSGLETAVFNPKCLAVRQGKTQNEPRRIFFVLFEIPEFQKFREAVRRLLIERGGDGSTFDQVPLTPVLYLAATDGGFQRWPSPVVAPDQECVAPVELSAL